MTIEKAWEIVNFIEARHLINGIDHPAQKLVIVPASPDNYNGFFNAYIRSNDRDRNMINASDDADFRILVQDEGAADMQFSVKPINVWLDENGVHLHPAYRQIIDNEGQYPCSAPATDS